MDTKPFIILFSVSFGLILLGAIIGNLLGASGALTKEKLGPNGIAVVMVFFFVLFLLMVFSLVPLFVRTFIALQIRIGNGEFFLIQWLQENERGVVYGFWGFCAAGLIIMYALAKDEILKMLR
jgi:hypothetical protein